MGLLIASGLTIVRQETPLCDLTGVWSALQNYVFWAR
jgi:hypothetical protein